MKGFSFESRSEMCGLKKNPLVSTHPRVNPWTYLHRKEDQKGYFLIFNLGCNEIFKLRVSCKSITTLRWNKQTTMAQSRSSSNCQRQHHATQERAAANTLFGDAFIDVDLPISPPMPPIFLRIHGEFSNYLSASTQLLLPQPTQSALLPLHPCGQCDRHR